jgi:hypothetical protein
MLLNYIHRNFNHKFDDKDFYEIINYLTYIIYYSITNRDIKSFLLFLYLHDTNQIIHRSRYEKQYNEWISYINYDFFYDIDGITHKDLIHYEINDEIEKKILEYLNKNLIQKEHYFLKRYSYLKFVKKIFILRLKFIGKLICLFKKTLEKRYFPGTGKGYLECLERWNSNLRL